MLELDKILYFVTSSSNYQTGWLWKGLYDELPTFESRWYLTVGKRFTPSRFVTRHGEWTLPWPQELPEKFKMPEYNPNFSKSFMQVTDEKALRIKERIIQGEKFVVMYSGGIDSTVVLTSLIKNLTNEELESVWVGASVESVIENPYFWNNFIQGKIKTIDSKITKYDDLIEAGLTPITADEGDCIFGTLIGLNMYNNYDYLISDLSEGTKQKLSNLKNRIGDADIHFSTYKDLIIKFLDVPDEKDFGRILYEKYVRNIETASVPVHSLHDFFWWLIFNVKYLNCSVRGALFYNDRVAWQDAIMSIENWYNDSEYQLWSMANNNNGQKIKQTPLSYKKVAKDYIYDFDKNHWYNNFKMKLESMWMIGNQQNVTHLDIHRRPNARIALTKDYEMIYTDTPGVKEYFLHHLSNYKINWTDI